jgi:hypothetical protein
MLQAICHRNARRAGANDDSIEFGCVSRHLVLSLRCCYREMGCAESQNLWNLGVEARTIVRRELPLVRASSFFFSVYCTELGQIALGF